MIVFTCPFCRSPLLSCTSSQLWEFPRRFSRAAAGAGKAAHGASSLAPSALCLPEGVSQTADFHLKFLLLLSAPAKANPDRQRGTEPASRGHVPLRSVCPTQDRGHRTSLSPFHPFSKEAGDLPTLASAKLTHSFFPTVLTGEITNPFPDTGAC